MRVIANFFASLIHLAIKISVSSESSLQRTTLVKSAYSIILYILCNLAQTNNRGKIAKRVSGGNYESHDFCLQ